MQAINLSTIARLGIFGGAFDPIHYGHLAIAEEARDRFALDAVLFIPTGEAPHKPRGHAGAEERYLMAQLATADHLQFAVSRIEVDRPGRSYTVDTLRLLREQYPQAALHLILGADMALDFPRWRQPEAILEMAEVIAATRPGTETAQIEQMLTDTALARMHLLPVPGLAISSTELRARVREGRTIRYLTPAPVVAYIAKERLYLGDRPSPASNHG